MGTSGCLCLNHTERLLSRSPGSLGILPHRVLQSFDLPHFEVLPHTPRVQFWMTSSPDLRLRPCTRSSPCRTADYIPALSCHHHPRLRVSIHCGASGNVTGVHLVTPYGFTVIGKPQEESSPVYNFPFTSAFILHYIGRYPIRHAGHYRMQIASPPVLELPPLSSKGI